jgi:hypothetical protein
MTMSFFDDDGPLQDDPIDPNVVQWYGLEKDRLRPEERRAFGSMVEVGRRLSTKQHAWVDRVRKELLQNDQDRALLQAAIDETPERSIEQSEAFGDMLEQIGDRATLSDRQRCWAERVSGVVAVRYGEWNTTQVMWQARPIPRGAEVPLPEVLRNLPKKPPGRR